MVSKYYLLSLASVLALSSCKLNSEKKSSSYNLEALESVTRPYMTKSGPNTDTHFELAHYFTSPPPGKSEIIGLLGKRGDLLFNIEAKDDYGRRGPSSGWELFKAMMDHFGEKVKVINGSWNYGDNQEYFVNELSRQSIEGKSKEEVHEIYKKIAAKTWTGKQAALFGFVPSVVKVDDDEIQAKFVKLK